MRIHALNQHVWPDVSPSASLEEELADALRDLGYDTVVVGGSGVFHEGTRSKPATPIVRLETRESGARNSQIAMLMDYFRFWKGMRSYCRQEVRPGDAVLATSSPFTNIFLIRTLGQRSGVIRMVHLHDYLPSNLKSLSWLHKAVAPAVKSILDHCLGHWDLVILASGNVDYRRANAVVAPFWPTITRVPGRQVDKTQRQALYAGNLGIVHDVDALAVEMKRLHDQGYEIDFYGDGPRVDSLPDFVHKHGFARGDEYLDVLYSHPVHLIAGTLADGTGSFPSKTLNSLLVGAEIHLCGFNPELKAEFDRIAAIPDLSKNLENAARLIADFIAERSSK